MLHDDDNSYIQKNETRNLSLGESSGDASDLLMNSSGREEKEMKDDNRRGVSSAFIYCTLIFNSATIYVLILF